MAVRIVQVEAVEPHVIGLDPALEFPNLTPLTVGPEPVFVDERRRLLHLRSVARTPRSGNLAQARANDERFGKPAARKPRKPITCARSSIRFGSFDHDVRRLDGD